VRWAGKLCDTDEASWTTALDDALEWKRRQRLRKVAAGARLHDFWTDERTLVDSFSALYIWRDPAAGKWQSQRAWSGITYVPGHCEALLRVGPSPAAAALAADSPPAEQALHPLLLCLTVSPAAGKEEAPCWLALHAHDPDDARAGGALLQLDASRVNSTAVALRAGVYRLSVHSATETADAAAGFFNFTVHAAAALPATELALADVPTASAAELSRKEARLEGDKAVYSPLEAGVWTVLVRAKLTLKAAAAGAAVGKDEHGRVPVVAELLAHDDRATGALRLMLVDNETGDATHFQGLRGTAHCLPGSVAGYTLLVDAQPTVALERASYALHVRAPVDAELALEGLQPAVEVEGSYTPSYAHTLANHFVLFRYVISAAARSHAALRVQLADPLAELTVSVYRQEPAAGKDAKGAAHAAHAEPPARTLLKAKAGVGSVVLAAVPLELAEGAKGATGGRVVVEATLAREAAERLGLLRAPRAPPPDPTWPAVPAPLRAHAAPDEAAPAAALAFKLSALSDTAVALVADDERQRALDAQKAGWEAKEAGRLARGRTSRIAFLVDTGAITAEEGARMLAEAAQAAPAAKGAKPVKEVKKESKGGSQPGSRAQTPAEGLHNRAVRAQCCADPVLWSGGGDGAIRASATAGRRRTADAVRTSLHTCAHLHRPMPHHHLRSHRARRACAVPAERARRPAARRGRRAGGERADARGRAPRHARARRARKGAARGARGPRRSRGREVMCAFTRGHSQRAPCPDPSQTTPRAGARRGARELRRAARRIGRVSGQEPRGVARVGRRAKRALHAGLGGPASRAQAAR
jgi:hypothetical protein